MSILVKPKSKTEQSIVKEAKETKVQLYVNHKGQLIEVVSMGKNDREVEMQQILALISESLSSLSCTTIL